MTHRPLRAAGLAGAVLALGLFAGCGAQSQGPAPAPAPSQPAPAESLTPRAPEPGGGSPTPSTEPGEPAVSGSGRDPNRKPSRAEVTSGLVRYATEIQGVPGPAAKQVAGCIVARGYDEWTVNTLIAMVDGVPEDASEGDRESVIRAAGACAQKFGVN